MRTIRPSGKSPTGISKHWGVFRYQPGGRVDYFRIGGNPPATREDVQNDLRKCLDEWFGDFLVG